MTVIRCLWQFFANYNLEFLLQSIILYQSIMLLLFFWSKYEDEDADVGREVSLFFLVSVRVCIGSVGDFLSSLNELDLSSQTSIQIEYDHVCPNLFFIVPSGLNMIML